MQIKKVHGWLMPVAVLIVLAVLSVSAVFAYTAKLSFTMPVTFNVENCTISSGGVVVFSSNQEEMSSNFAVTPITENTLEISCTYNTSTFSGGVITFSVNTGFTLELTKLTIYGALAFEKGQTGLENGDYVSQTFANQNLSISLLSGLKPEVGDDVVFIIEVT